jgi:Cu2+-containing amine oxidase
VDDIASAASLAPAALGGKPAYRGLLEPLSPGEIRSVVAIVKADPAFGPAVLFELW